MQWLLRLLKHRKPCDHEFDYMHDMKPRDKHGIVSCVCYKCGVEFKADCGLNLPGKLVQRAAAIPASNKEQA